MYIVLRPRQTVRVMSVIVICLLLNHIGLRLLEFHSDLDCASGVFRYYCRLFTVNEEGMIPTMYSTVALLFCSAILAVIGAANKRSGAKRSTYWLGLAFIFLFLAMDEALEFHEQFVGPVRAALHISSGPFYYAWVIPYGFAVIILALVYLRFLASLPRKTRLQFIVAGSVYVFGALGFELLGGNQAAANGPKSLMYIVFSTAEELFEMGGIVLFVNALLSYASSQFSDVGISVRPD